MTRKITVCTTCKFSATSAFDDKGQTGGELMLTALQQAAKERGDDTSIGPQECLWSCEQSCSVLLQDSEKVSYLTGKFNPDAEAANAILDWFALHGKTDDGNVPLEQWPKAMYSHFIARIPPISASEPKS